MIAAHGFQGCSIPCLSKMAGWFPMMKVLLVGTVCCVFDWANRHFGMYSNRIAKKIIDRNLKLWGFNKVDFYINVLHLKLNKCSPEKLIIGYFDRLDFYWTGKHFSSVWFSKNQMVFFFGKAYHKITVCGRDGPQVIGIVIIRKIEAPHFIICIGFSFGIVDRFLIIFIAVKEL